MTREERSQVVELMREDATKWLGKEPEPKDGGDPGRAVGKNRTYVLKTE